MYIHEIKNEAGKVLASFKSRKKNTGLNRAMDFAGECRQNVNICMHVITKK